MGFKKPSTELKNFIDKPGTFHVVVNSLVEKPVHNGEMKDRIDVGISVLAGTDPSQVKRETTLRLTNPNEGQKDGGEFCGRVLSRLAEAADIPAIVTLESGERQYVYMKDVPEGEDIDIDWQGPDHAADPENVAPWLIGKQFVVKMREKKGDDDKVRIEMDGAHFYHVTDPEVREVPKDWKALEIGGYKDVPKPTAASAPAGGNGAPKPANGAAGAPAKGAAKPTASGAKTTAPAGGAPKPAAGSPVGKPAPAAVDKYGDL